MRGTINIPHTHVHTAHANRNRRELNYLIDARACTNDGVVRTYTHVLVAWINNRRVGS